MTMKKPGWHRFTVIRAVEECYPTYTQARQAFNKHYKDGVITTSERRRLVSAIDRIYKYGE